MDATVPAIYPPKFPIKSRKYILNINFESTRCGRHVWNIGTACLNIPTHYLNIIFNHLEPATNAKHQHLTNTSPSPLGGMWANVNLPQTPRHEFDDESRTTRIRPRFDNSNRDSTTAIQIRQPQSTIQVQQRHRLELHNDEGRTTRIRQQHGFDNDRADSKPQYEFDNDRDPKTMTRSRDMGRLISFLLNGEKSGMDWREGNYCSGGTLQIRFTLSSLLTTSLCPHEPLLSKGSDASNPTWTPQT